MVFNQETNQYKNSKSDRMIFWIFTMVCILITGYFLALILSNSGGSMLGKIIIAGVVSVLAFFGWAGISNIILTPKDQPMPEDDL